MKRSTPMKRTGRLRGGKSTSTPTKDEARWMAAIAEFGCIVCWLEYRVRTPAAVHHILSGGRRIGHLETIPLCDPGHHQNAAPGSGMISRHPDKARFESRYGTEQYLLEQTRLVLGWKTEVAA